MGGSNVSENPHGLLYATCITLFRGSLGHLAQRLYDETGLFDRIPEQVIVNEYEPGQGIALHTDHRGFGATVCTISLGTIGRWIFRRMGATSVPRCSLAALAYT